MTLTQAASYLEKAVMVMVMVMVSGHGQWS
jgi:hypothetical protein